LIYDAEVSLLRRSAYIAGRDHSRVNWAAGNLPRLPE